MSAPYTPQNNTELSGTGNGSTVNIVFSNADKISPAPLWDGTLPPLSTASLSGYGALELTPLAVEDSTRINLTIPQKFNITRPAEKLTTTYDKYFITGTSDPDLPVYFGDSEIERQGSKGVFGILVDLKTGPNNFTFRQGDKTENVSITRKNSVNPDAVPIKEIRQNSMVPSIFSGAKAGGTLELSCTAPSGASVTAVFDGQSVRLNQTKQVKPGLPVKFEASLTLSDNYDDDVTRKIGKVKYRLDYQGSSKEYTSTGDVYVAGRDSNVAVRVKSYMGFVYPNVNNMSQIKEKLKEGSTDYLKSQDNTYAGLSSGGFVNKEHLEVVTGHVSVNNKFSKVRLSGKSKSESYLFTGTNSPAYASKLSDGKFYITFYNTTGEPLPNISNSKIFSDISVKSDEKSVTYVFTQKNSGYWGHVIDFTEDGTVLTFKYRPKLSSGSRPLDGITVILDPGHGGTDTGALGLAQMSGPAEKDVNLAHALATREVLESMGAKVALARRQDTFLSLDDRLRAQEKANSDFFVSIHHNSIGENVDANKINGVEVYYHSAMSKKLANSMMSSITNSTDRNPRFVSQSYYRVTLSPYSPSILLELGYMSNPFEYERAANQSQIKKAAEAIANGIVRSLS